MHGPDRKNHTRDTGRAGSSEPFFASVRADLQAVDDFIRSALITEEPALHEMIDHVISPRGKMIRPGFVLLSGRLFGRSSDNHIHAGAMAEMLHIATLLHDDVIDQASRRRGSQTVNKLYGDKAAVFLGGYVLARAMGPSSSERMYAVSNELARSAMRVCDGEMQQNTVSAGIRTTENEYEQIIANKTADLFGSCCWIGAFLSGARQEHCECLRQYGINFGMAFQITDDILDVTGSAETVGKDLGRDAARFKPSLPLIRFAVTSPDATETLASSPTKQQLQSRLQEAGSIDYAAAKARRYADKAISSLQPLAHICEVAGLEKLAKFAIARRH